MCYSLCSFANRLHCPWDSALSVVQGHLHPILVNLEARGPLAWWWQSVINFWLTRRLLVPSVFSSLHLPDSCYTHSKSHLLNVSMFLPRVFSRNQEKSLSVCLVFPIMRKWCCHHDHVPLQCDFGKLRLRGFPGKLCGHPHTKGHFPALFWVKFRLYQGRKAMLFHEDLVLSIVQPSALAAE